MKKSEAFPSRFWKATDLDEPIALKIAFVSREALENLKGEVEDKSILHFADHKRQLVLNATNWDSIADITGEDDDADWTGFVVELFQDKTRVGAKTVPCIRVRAPGAKTNAEATPRPKQKPKKPLKEDIEDEIGF